MSSKGFRYEYELQSKYPQEYEAVNFAYLQAGWKEIGALPEEGLPTHIIFEWQNDGTPYYPSVNWPCDNRPPYCAERR